MGEKVLKFPAIEVLDTLLEKHRSNKEKVATINGELGERLRTQYDLHGDFTPFAWGLISKIAYVFRTNELRAREMVRIGRAALDFVEDHMNRHGHPSDIADMALKAAEQPQGSKPAEQAAADKQVADNVVALEKGIKQTKPKDVKAKADKAEKTSDAKQAKPKDSVDKLREELSAGKDAKGSFVAEQAAENAKGDEHIKNVAEELAQPEKAEKPDKGSHGRYQLIS